MYSDGSSFSCKSVGSRFGFFGSSTRKKRSVFRPSARYLYSPGVRSSSDCGALDNCANAALIATDIATVRKNFESDMPDIVTAKCEPLGSLYPPTLSKVLNGLIVTGSEI